jgi:hypothetical protein
MTHEILTCSSCGQTYADATNLEKIESEGGCLDCLVLQNQGQEEERQEKISKFLGSVFQHGRTL